MAYLKLRNGQIIEIQIRDCEIDGSVEIKADGFFLITMTPDGTFRRVRNISPSLGLELDNENRIVETVNTDGL